MPLAAGLAVAASAVSVAGGAKNAFGKSKTGKTSAGYDPELERDKERNRTAAELRYAQLENASLQIEQSRVASENRALESSETRKSVLSYSAAGLIGAFALVVIIRKVWKSL